MTINEAREMFPIGAKVAVAGHIGRVQGLFECDVAFIGRKVFVDVEGVGEFGVADVEVL